MKKNGKKIGAISLFGQPKAASLRFLNLKLMTFTCLEVEIRNVCSYVLLLGIPITNREDVRSPF